MTERGRWREVDDRVYVRRHEAYDLNVGLVVGDGGCLVIDTREHLAAGRELADAVRQVTAARWTVVNTHAHFDHYLGNAAFAPAEIWALDRCRAVIEQYGEVQRRIQSHVARRAGEDATARELDASPVVAPSRSFAGPSSRIDVGGRAITLRHLGRGHTDNDIVITVADCAAVFAGDLVEEGAPPAFEDAFPIEWVATLGALLPLLSGPVVPGHGDVVDAGYVVGQRDLLERVAATARTDAATVAGLPDDVAAVALGRARAELIGDVHRPAPEELLAEFGLS
jgi:glyoxylase-like metal-dependent hydrolase (beta-lactamase superfamily II)